MSEEELKKRLEMLRIEHRDLDAAIDALTSAGSSDQLQIARLKKRKLRLKDQIAIIEDTLLPDIIARSGACRLTRSPAPPRSGRRLRHRDRDARS